MPMQGRLPIAGDRGMYIGHAQSGCGRDLWGLSAVWLPAQRFLGAINTSIQEDDHSNVHFDAA